MSESESSSLKAKALIVIVIAAAGFAAFSWQRQKGASIERYNRVIEQQVNRGHFHDAAGELERMRPTATGELKQKIEQSLVQCYLAIAEDPGNSLKVSADWLAKAQKIDPAALSDQQKKVIDMAGKLP